jgi:UDP-N-acetylmuramoyl-L-alanine--D-glutamate ligase
MNIAVLGGGVEGKALKKYFTSHGHHVQIFDNFKDEDIKNFQLSDFDQVFRSPSVRPLDKSWTSMTQYFFEHCKAKIIGVTGTKGKGTTCSIITSILRSIMQQFEWSSRTVWLVGNIGIPSIEALDHIAEDDIVVFEMSSFQLWDLEQSPHIAVVLRVEQDHLDRHYSLEDYHQAKANITKHQTSEDYCIYYRNNQTSAMIGNLSVGKKLTYPIPESDQLTELLDCLSIPGAHNRENAEAAILAVASFLNLSLTDLLTNSNLVAAVKAGLTNFTGLPHRLQFIRELNNVRYYDDNYSSAFPATDVALKTFENDPTILIAGGKDRGLDLTDFKARLFNAKNLRHVILIGENKTRLAADEDPQKFILADSLETAVNIAQSLAEKIVEDTRSNYDLCLPVTVPLRPVVLMSPGSASFDMFKNFEDRGQQYQNLINYLK